MAKVENQNEWAIKAKNILKSELKRKDIGYRDLAAKLTSMGTEISEQGVANKISRGGFSAAFFLQSLEAAEVSSVQLN